MAVLDEVVDEQVDPGCVVEQHRAVARAGTALSKKTHGSRRAPTTSSKTRAVDPDGRDEQPVDPVGEQRLGAPPPLVRADCSQSISITR